jgi:hypothetical protein
MTKNLTDIEKIEYYLGKDKFKDKFFKAEFPHAYADISPTHGTMDSMKKGIQYLNIWDKTIEFNINNLGYRSDFDFDIDNLKTKKLILCFGCTDTFGLQLHNQQTWPYKLQERLTNYAILNCGTIAASSDTISRLIVKITHILKNIEHICILWPHNNRREFVSKEYTGIITSHNVLNVPFEQYWDFIDWKSDNYNFFKNYHLIKNVCLSNNIKLLDLEINRFDKKVPYDYSNKYFALGENTQTAISTYFYKKISSIPSLFEVLKK